MRSPLTFAVALVCLFALGLGFASADAGASPATRVAFSPGNLGVNPGEVQLLSSHVYDYTFSDAPADWTARGGLWTTTNRWTCSPQWSWYGGFSNTGVAALWNKHQFTGDVTLETYLAFKMGVNVTRGSYKHPNDMNLVLAGDGINPASGYCFIIGGERNTVTRIMKGTKVLAETRAPEFLLPVFENGYPASNDWHHKWWGLRARQHGDLLQLYYDDKLALEARDPDPLPGGYVGVWTANNGLIMPRAKIYYAGEKIHRDPVPGDDIALAPADDKAPAPIVLSSSTHPSVQSDFETSVGSSRNTTGDNGATLSLVSPGADGKGHCLALWNKVPGGDAGASIIEGRFDVREMPLLAFDYKVTSDTKVNVYLSIGEKLYEVVFTGLKTPAPLATIIGQIPNIVTDNKWHHAEFDLLGALEATAGPAGVLPARNLFLGNLNDANYLRSGFGGNHAGTIYYLDNFFLGKPAGRAVKIAAQSTAAATGYAAKMDRDPYGKAPEEATSKDGVFELTAAEDGTWYVHARAQLATGKWGPMATYLARVDTVGPKMAATSPAAGEKVMDGPITVTFADPGGSFILPSSVQVKLAGVALTLGKPGVTFNVAENSLTIDPRDAGVTFKDGQSAQLEVLAALDLAGNALAKPIQVAFKAAVDADKTPPTAPKLTFPEGAAYLCDDNFETNMGEWAAYGGSESADLSLDDSTAPVGSTHSLKIYNREEGNRFGVFVRRTPFDAGKYRYISFDYKVPERLRGDLAVFVNGEWKAIKFKDNDDNLTMVGEVPGLVDDNQWHHTQFDLYQMLRQNDPGASSYIVRQFVIVDWGWTSNVQGQNYHIANFRIAPVTTGAQPIPVKWDAEDAGGVAGVSYLVDDSPGTVPPKKINSSSHDLALQANGDKLSYLHVRAVDTAGNWGPTTTYEMHLSSSIPVAAAVAPAAGGKAAASEIALKLSDPGPAGIDPASVKLNVAGTDYGVDGASLTYNSAAGALVFNAEQVSPRPVVFPNGADVAVKLTQAKDYAGNSVAALPAWSWTMDYTLDKKPPTVDSVTSTTHPTFLTNTFTDGLGMWLNRGGAQGAAVALDPTGGPKGGPAVKLTQQQAGGHMQALICNQPYAVEKYPYVAFDYKYQAGVKLDLLAYTEGTWYAVALSDDPAGAVGRVPGFTADGTWHKATIDLASILRRQLPRGSLIVEYLIVSDRNQMENPAGATAWFGNFIIGRVGRSQPLFRWKATDATGIEGYSYVLDQVASTVPPAQITDDKNVKAYDDLTPGVWYFHIRAKDGAGNWGPTRTYAALHMSVE